MTTAVPVSAPPPGRTARVRRWVVRTTIGAFSLAALLGIVALLGPGPFDESEGKVLLTTVLVGVVCMAVLCYLATAGRRTQVVGIAGGVTVVVPFVLGLVLLWSDPASAVQDDLIRAFGVGSVVALTLAQTCLVLGLADSSRVGVRRLAWVAMACAAVVAVLTSLLIVGLDVGDTYFRTLGVVAILDVLGTVVAAALAKFGGASTPFAPTDVVLPQHVLEQVRREAERVGISPEEVVVRAVTEHLASTRRPG